MPTITYKAQSDNGRHFVRAATAQDAVRLYLQSFKHRTFSVQEERDGVFKTALTALLDPAKRGPDDCFFKGFKTRQEAQAFVAQAQPIRLWTAEELRAR